MTNRGDACPVCGSGALEQRTSTCEMIHLGVDIRAPSKYSVCDCCGSEVVDADDMQFNKQAMSHAKLMAKIKGETA